MKKNEKTQPVIMGWSGDGADQFGKTMERLVSKQAVAFAEWIELNGYWAEDINGQLAWSSDSVSPENIPTNDLYEIFKQQ